MLFGELTHAVPYSPNLSQKKTTGAAEILVQRVARQFGLAETLFAKPLSR